jgi:hypothetical protein
MLADREDDEIDGDGNPCIAHIGTLSGRTPCECPERTLRTLTRRLRRRGRNPRRTGPRLEERTPRRTGPAFKGGTRRARAPP